MGLFSKRETGPRQDPRLDELLLAVRRLEDRLEKVEKPVRDLEMEWEDWFEKFRNLYGRISKRAQRAEKKDDEDQEEGPRIGNPMAIRLMAQGGFKQ